MLAALLVVRFARRLRPDQLRRPVAQLALDEGAILRGDLVQVVDRVVNLGLELLEARVGGMFDGEQVVQEGR